MVSALELEHLVALGKSSSKSEGIVRALGSRRGKSDEVRARRSVLNHFRKGDSLVGEDAEEMMPACQLLLHSVHLGRMSMSQYHRAATAVHVKVAAPIKASDVAAFSVRRNEAFIFGEPKFAKNAARHYSLGIREHSRICSPNRRNDCGTVCH